MKKLLLFVVVVVILAASAQAAITDNIVAYWNFNESAGNFVDMYVGHDLTNSGAAYGAVGQIGNAADFEDGENDHATRSDHVDFSFTDGAGTDEAFSVSFWFKPESVGSDFLFAKASSSNGEYYGGIVSNKARFHIYDANFANYLDASSTEDDLTAGNWYHVVMTYDGSELDTGLEIYVNNDLQTVTRTSSGYTGMGNEALDFTIARRDSDTTLDSDGIFDDFGVWNRELTAAEVASIYANGTAGHNITYTPPPSSNNTFTVNANYAYNFTDLSGATVKFYNRGILRATKTSASNGNANYNTSNASITYVNITISKTGFYNATITNQPYNTTRSANLSMRRYNITTATTKIGVSLSTPFNCTTRGGRTFTSCLNIELLNSTSIVQFNKNSYFSKNQTIASGSSPSVGTFNVTGVYDAKLNITAINAFTGATINTFNGWFYHIVSGTNESFSTTTGKAIVNISKGTYTVHINASGYSTFNSTLNTTVSATYNAIQFGLYTPNTIFVFLQKESDGSYILNNNITIILGNATGEQTYYSNQDYTLNFSGLQDGNYTFKFSNTNYSLRSYVVTVSGGIPSFLHAYLTPSNTTVLFTIKDEDNLAPVGGALIGFYRYVNNTYSLVESHNTDVTGRTEFTFTYGIKYAITITKSGYETKTFTLDPILFTSYTVYLTPTSNEDQSYNDATFTFTPTTYYKNLTNNFIILFNSPSGVFNNYTILIESPDPGSPYTQTGNNAIGGSYSTTLNLTSATIFDTVNITVSYHTSFGENYTYTYRYGIVGIYNGTMLEIKDNTYGLGWFERTLLGTLIVIIAAGLATMVAGVTIGAGFGLIILLFLSYLGLMPVIAATFTAVGLVFIISRKVGEP